MADSGAVQVLLEKMRAAKIDATAGMIQMVQLGEARAAFGDQWPKMAETAMSLSETLLKHRLDQSDIFCRYMAYGFVVVFTGLEPESAERRAEVLSKEISQLLLQRPELKAAFGAHQATGLISELTGADGAARLETMTRELEARCQTKNLQNGTKPLGKGAAPVPASQEKPKPCAPTKVSQEHNDPPKTKKAATATKPAAPPIPKQSPPKPKLIAQYQPMLLVPKRTVGISVGVPCRRGNDGEWLIGQKSYTRGLGGDHNLSLDLFMCNQVVAALQRTAEAGSPAIIAGMARLESLGASSEFATVYGTLSETQRKRFILEIVALDPNTPASKIQEAFGRYRSITKNLVLHVAPTNTEFRKYADVGVRAVGCHLNDTKAGGSSAGNSGNIAKAFGSSAKRAGLRCHIHGVTEEDTLAAAIAGGAQYIAGSIIGPMVDSPFAPYPFTAAATSDAA